MSETTKQSTAHYWVGGMLALIICGFVCLGLNAVLLPAAAEKKAQEEKTAALERRQAEQAVLALSNMMDAVRHVYLTDTNGGTAQVSYVQAQVEPAQPEDTNASDMVTLVPNLTWTDKDVHFVGYREYTNIFFTDRTRMTWDMPEELDDCETREIVVLLHRADGNVYRARWVLEETNPVKGPDIKRRSK